LPVNVRTLGWDWTSFLSFGLCNADTALGESFSKAQDPVALLGGGDPGHLPKYLFVIAIADESRVMELRTWIKEHHYLESPKTMQKTLHKDMSRGIDDKDHGMER
jgi:hypothetical protein